MVATAMGAAFMRAGIDPNEAAFRVDLARYLNNGGTTARAFEIVREAACAMPDEGLTSGAADGQASHADVRQQDGDGRGRAGGVAGGDRNSVAPPSPINGDGAGHPIPAGSGHSASARPSPTGGDEAGQSHAADAGHRSSAASSPANGDGAGPTVSAGNGQIIIARPSPAKEPSLLDRSAMIAARKLGARAIMRIDGLDIRDFTIGQALTDARRKGKEHYVLSVLGGMYKGFDQTKTFREVSTDAEIESVIRQAEAFANAS